MREDDVFAKPEATSVRLEDLSVADLQSRIVDLKDEIAACEALIGAKMNSRAAADAFFSAGGSIGS
jgi:uncharacterized small protein (DUF1192 family)